MSDNFVHAPRLVQETLSALRLGPLASGLADLLADRDFEARYHAAIEAGVRGDLDAFRIISAPVLEALQKECNTRGVDRHAPAIEFSLLRVQDNHLVWAFEAALETAFGTVADARVPTHLRTYKNAAGEVVHVGAASGPHIAASASTAVAEEAALLEHAVQHPANQSAYASACAIAAAYGRRGSAFKNPRATWGDIAARISRAEVPCSTAKHLGADLSGAVLDAIRRKRLFRE